MSEHSYRFCPFCGADAGDLGVHRTDIGAYYVRCINCLAEGPARNSEGSAVRWWNKRKNSSDIEAVRAAERERIAKLFDRHKQDEYDSSTVARVIRAMGDEKP